MRIGFCLVCAGVLALSVKGQEESLSYDFDEFKDGPIDGQMEWNVYDKTRDSSPLSIENELGTTERRGDRALVVRKAPRSIRCVTGEYVRWLPGRTLSMEFDFKVAVEPTNVSVPKSSLTVMVGDKLLDPDARFTVGLRATPNGDWTFTGAMPKFAEKRVYSENFLYRDPSEVAISKWHRFEMELKKHSTADTFSAWARITNAETGEVVAKLVFDETASSKAGRGVWESPRAHVGFGAQQDMIGLVCVDNLEVKSYE